MVNAKSLPSSSLRTDRAAPHLLGVALVALLLPTAAALLYVTLRLAFCVTGQEAPVLRSDVSPPRADTTTSAAGVHPGPTPEPLRADAFLPEVLGRVGERVVTREVLWRRIHRKVERVVAAQGTIAPSLMRYLGRPLVHQLVQEWVLLDKAKAAGFIPDGVRAKAHVDKIRQTEDGRVQLERVLAENAMDDAEYLRELAIRTAIKDWVSATFTAPQTVTDQEARVFYDENPELFRIAARTKMSRLVVPVATGNVPSGEAPLSAGPAEELVRTLRSRLEGGEPFAGLSLGEGDVAETYTSVAEEWVKDKELPREVANAITGLTAHQLSPVIRLPGAFVVVRWDEKRPEGTKAFEDALPTLRQNLRIEKGLKAFKAFLAEQMEEQDAEIYPPFD